MYSECYPKVTDYRSCIPLLYADYIASAPSFLINAFTPIKFIWDDNNKGGRVGNYEYRGLKIGDRVLFQSWQKFHPI